MMNAILKSLGIIALLVFIATDLAVSNARMKTELTRQMTADIELANAKEERALTQLQIDNEETRAELYEALK